MKQVCCCLQMPRMEGRGGGVGGGGTLLTAKCPAPQDSSCIKCLGFAWDGGREEMLAVVIDLHIMYLNILLTVSSFHQVKNVEIPALLCRALSSPECSSHPHKKCTPPSHP